MITRKNAVAAAIAACAVLLATAPAAAADGEILIDQVRVNAGGITAGDDPGFPATLRSSGRYKLTGNLRVPAGRSGIRVTKNDVTIDLNGFTISSDPPGEAVHGVIAPDVSGLQIMNGTITGFASLAVFSPAGLAMVENMRLVSNQGGIFFGPDSKIRHSTIADNVTGIACMGCLIEQNVVAGNSNVGIAVPDPVGIPNAGGVVLRNVVVGNGDLGLDAHGTTGYGNNILFGNNGGSAQVAGPAFQLHPNLCEPACP